LTDLLLKYYHFTFINVSIVHVTHKKFQNEICLISIFEVCAVSFACLLCDVLCQTNKTDVNGYITTHTGITVLCRTHCVAQMKRNIKISSDITTANRWP